VIQSGSIEEDLRILLSARRLVIGHTSFASSVAMLSTNCAASIPEGAVTKLGCLRRTARSHVVHPAEAIGFERKVSGGS
jgi:hypothetical protein